VDLHERGARAQQTDLVQLDAEIVDAAREASQQVVTVRFSGLVRESAQAPAEPFDELWHFVQPAGGGDWAVAGIQPIA
jgi:predicted lipid-binding transport protein (Tim44 family)